MSGHREHWDSYMCLVEDRATSMFLDLGYGEDAPIAGKPWLIRVKLRCHAAQENGMATADELSALQDLEEKVLAFTDTRKGVTYVGSITNGAAREIVYYAGKKDAIREDDLGMAPADRRADTFVEATDDPDWEYYLEFMFPSPQEFRRIMDNGVLRNLERDGDVATTPRRVDHWIHFEERETRDHFAAWAKKEGYQIESLFEPDGERDAIGVQIHHVTDVTPRTIHGVIASIVNAAEQMGGEYDGWETFVMKER